MTTPFTAAPAAAGPDLARFDPAQTAPAEQVLIRHTRGSGRFSEDKRFISLEMDMFDPTSGRPDGYHEGVWEALFSDPRELLAVPPQPQRSFSDPVGPIPALEPSAATKGIWSFGDGSAIYAVGPAMSTLTPLEDGSFLFMVATMQWITHGTGRFEGAQGLKSSLGSTHIPAGVNLFGPDPVEFTATTVDTFRVMGRERIGSPPG